MLQAFFIAHFKCNAGSNCVWPVVSEETQFMDTEAALNFIVCLAAIWVFETPKNQHQWDTLNKNISKLTFIFFMFTYCFISLLKGELSGQWIRVINILLIKKKILESTHRSVIIKISLVIMLIPVITFAVVVFATGFQFETAGEKLSTILLHPIKVYSNIVKIIQKVCAYTVCITFSLSLIIKLPLVTRSVSVWIRIWLEESILHFYCFVAILSVFSILLLLSVVIFLTRFASA